MSADEKTPVEVEVVDRGNLDGSDRSDHDRSNGSDHDRSDRSDHVKEVSIKALSSFTIEKPLEDALLEIIVSTEKMDCLFTFLVYRK